MFLVGAGAEPHLVGDAAEGHPHEALVVEHGPVHVGVRLQILGVGPVDEGLDQALVRRDDLLLAPRAGSVDGCGLPGHHVAECGEGLWTEPVQAHAAPKWSVNWTPVSRKISFDTRYDSAYRSSKPGGGGNAI